MSREEAINILNGDNLNRCAQKEKEALDMAIKALEQNESAEEWYKLFVKKLDEQEPCDDTYNIRKDILKCRVGNIVAYNVEWLKKHWQMEMDIVCGVKPCTDAVSREAVKAYKYHRTMYPNFEDYVDILPSVQPKPIECDDAEQIDYHDDFATSLKKINDYEMTRDERAAISILNAYKVGYESAIEDYKQEPCDDAISRKDIEECEELMTDINGDTVYAVRMSDIRQLPSVTHKSGKWIYRREDKYSCSKCGATTSVDESGIEEKPMYKFCPYCGAYMVEPQESEE